MIRTTSHTIRPRYWSLLKDLNDDAKMDLIILLTQSLRSPKEEVRISARDFYGIWGDDGYTDEEFVDELKKSRTFHHDIVEL